MIPSRRDWWIAAAGVGAVALVASIAGLWNDFVYDDRYVILHNKRIDGLGTWWRFFAQSYWPPNWGGDGYRPLTILAFSIEWAAGNGSPMLYHAVNIAIYVATCVAAFWLASLLLPLAYAAMAAALFAAHPVHVEAAANIVGQSELLVALLTLVASALYVRWRTAETFDLPRQTAIALLYATACFVKEHAIVLPALLLVLELFALRARSPLATRLRALRPFGLALVAIALAYLLIRSRVLTAGVVGFQQYVPFQMLSLDTPRRILTMIGLVPVWVRLLLWPVHLSTEYGPPQHPIADGPSLEQLPGLLILLGVLALIVVARKKHPIAVIGLLWLIIALLPSSNFLVPSGILIAERTLFLPSFGAMLAIGAAMPEVAARLSRRWTRVAAFSAVAVLIVAATGRSVARTMVWRDNVTLFSDAVRTAPLVYRTHYMLGGWHFSVKQVAEGEREYLIALRLFPNEPYIAYNLADEYRKRGMCAPAVRMYRRALAIAPAFHDAKAQVAVCLAALGRWSEARQATLEALRSGKTDFPVMRKILRGAAIHAPADSGRHTGSRTLPDTSQSTPPAPPPRTR